MTSLRGRGARRPWAKGADQVIGALALFTMFLIWVAALAPCTIWLIFSLVFRPRPNRSAGALLPAPRAP